MHVHAVEVEGSNCLTHVHNDSEALSDVAYSLLCLLVTPQQGQGLCVRLGKASLQWAADAQSSSLCSTLQLQEVTLAPGMVQVHIPRTMALQHLDMCLLLQPHLSFAMS